MNKELARYFVKLIAENLQFSFNGMGIPSYSCEWLENQLMQENFLTAKKMNIQFSLKLVTMSISK